MYVYLPVHLNTSCMNALLATGQICALMTPHYRLLHRAVANVRPLVQRGAGKGCATVSQQTNAVVMLVRVELYTNHARKSLTLHQLCNKHLCSSKWLSWRHNIC